MILLHVVCNDKQQAVQVADLLIDQKLVLDAMVSEKLLFKRLKSGELKNQERTLVMGSTKALLFKTINDALCEKFGDNLPLIYAMPIVYMDEGQTAELKLETRKV